MGSVIEYNKRLLIYLANKYGFGDPLVVEHSQRLDKLLFIVQRRMAA